MRGILHIGAHFGEERFYYASLSKPVMWIEAVPDYFETLSSNISECQDQQAHLLLLSDDEKEVDFYIANNEGASSSLFQLSKRSGFQDSGLRMEGAIRLKATRLDKAFDKEAIRHFDHWVLDVQGAELEVLVGAGELLNFCNSIMVEVSRREVYIGGTDYFELIHLLRESGFIQIWEAHSGEHMDVLFMRRVVNVTG